MGQFITLQQQITVTGDNSTADFQDTQPMDQFANTNGWGVAFITFHTRSIIVATGSTVELDLGTVDQFRTGGLGLVVPSGAAGPVMSFPNLSANSWYKAFIGLESQPQGAGTYPIENLVGWNLFVRQGTGSGGAFSVTFEAFLTLKQPV